MNIILITTGGRPDLLRQSLESLRDNAADWSKHTITLVMDGINQGCDSIHSFHPLTYIDHSEPMGASRARNIGASSIPKYRRQEHVCFLDDDVYACPGPKPWEKLEAWDNQLLRLAEPNEECIISGHAHPYNHAKKKSCNSGSIQYEEPLLISTVNMVMPWSLWDDVGYFVEPGGPGGSEDYNYCMRAKAKGYGFAVTDPHCIIHCGLTSSRGQQIVGYDLVVAKNRELVKNLGLEKKVVFA